MRPTSTGYSVWEPYGKNCKKEDIIEMKLVGEMTLVGKKTCLKRLENLQRFKVVGASKKKKGKAYVVETCCHHIKFFVLSTYIIMYH